jgi:hypothetical protein
MGIDVDAVINESENSLSEPSVQFVTLSSVVIGSSATTDTCDRKIANTPQLKKKG